jgi:hypothetical protein
MTLLLIIIILMLAFPAFRRFVGGCLSVVLWIILVFLVLAIFLAFFHGAGSNFEEKYTINGRSTYYGHDLRRRS